MKRKFIVVSGIVFIDGFGIVNDVVEELVKKVDVIVNLVVIIDFD